MKSVIRTMLAVLLCLSLLASFAACGTDPADSSKDPSSADAEISSEPSGTEGETSEQEDPATSEETPSGDVTSEEPSTGSATSKPTSSKPASSKPTSSAVTSSVAPKKTGSHIVTPKYACSETIIADYDVTEYGADKTGAKDSTSAIQSVINDCYQAGGGTVWMPAGKYLITGSIQIPPLVTLRGDWQDPDKGTSYGTIILAKVPSSDSTATGLFTLQPSSGVKGLTIYYPDQSISSVKPYPYTFYAPTDMLKTIENCTILNGYRGIGTSQSDPHEMLMIKNVKGTVLRTGVAIYNSSDVGTVDGLVLSSKYWANAGSGLNKASASAIESWSKSHSAEGMSITDAEQQQYNNVSISGYAYAIRFPNVTTRYMGAGSFFNLKISNCDYGLYADNGTHNSGTLTTIDNRWGYVVSGSSISASKYSIYNASSSLGGRTGTIKLCGVTLSGPTSGTVTNSSKNSSYSAITVKAKPDTKTTGKGIKVLSAGASESSIQSALDALSSSGGVVYLKAGKYFINKGLTVPKNVELRGVAGSPMRIADRGSVLVINMSTVASAASAEKATPAVTLNGENAGVSGIFFCYSKNAVNINNGAPYVHYGYAVKGNAAKVYCTNCCIAGATHGICFTGCNNHVIENLAACCFVNTISVSGDNGRVANCLQNGTVLYRMNYNAPGDEANNLFSHLLCPITGEKNEYIRVGAGSGEQILNCFIYGGHKMILATNAVKLQIVNVGADNLGCDYQAAYKKTYTASNHPFFTMKGGSATVVNALRYNGISYTNTDCTLKIFNRMAIGTPGESDV